MFRNWSHQLWRWNLNATKTGKCTVSYNKGWQGCSGSEAHSTWCVLPTSIFQTALRAAAQTTYKAKQNERLFGNKKEPPSRKGRLDTKPATRATVAKASTSTSPVTTTANRPVIKRRRRQRKSPADRIDHTYSLRSRKSADNNYASRV